MALHDHRQCPILQTLATLGKWSRRADFKEPDRGFSALPTTRLDPGLSGAFPAFVATYATPSRGQVPRFTRVAPDRSSKVEGKPPFSMSTYTIHGFGPTTMRSTPTDRVGSTPLATPRPPACIAFAMEFWGAFGSEGDVFASTVMPNGCALIPSRRAPCSRERRRCPSAPYQAPEGTARADRRSRGASLPLASDGLRLGGAR
jgi:hypothetical protein